MNTPSSMQALRRANPRAEPGFADSVAAAAETLHARIAATADVAPTGADLATAGADVTATGADLAAGTRLGARRSGRRAPPGSGRSTPRRLMVASTVGTLVAAAVVVVVPAVGMLPGAGPDVANAANRGLAMVVLRHLQQPRRDPGARRPRQRATPARHATERLDERRGPAPDGLGSHGSRVQPGVSASGTACLG